MSIDPIESTNRSDSYTLTIPQISPCTQLLDFQIQQSLNLLTLYNLTGSHSLIPSGSLDDIRPSNDNGHRDDKVDKS